MVLGGPVATVRERGEVSGAASASLRGPRRIWRCGWTRRARDYLSLWAAPAPVQPRPRTCAITDATVLAQRRGADDRGAIDAALSPKSRRGPRTRALPGQGRRSKPGLNGMRLGLGSPWARFWAQLTVGFYTPPVDAGGDHAAPQATRKPSCFYPHPQHMRAPAGPLRASTSARRTHSRTAVSVRSRSLDTRTY